MPAGHGGTRKLRGNPRAWLLLALGAASAEAGVRQRSAALAVEVRPGGLAVPPAESPPAAPGGAGHVPLARRQDWWFGAPPQLAPGRAGLAGFHPSGADSPAVAPAPANGTHAAVTEPAPSASSSPPVQELQLGFARLMPFSTEDADRLRGTALLLKINGRLTRWVRRLVARYHRQLSRWGAEVSILQDVSGTPEDHGQVEKRAYQMDDITVPLCRVSWRAAVKAFGQKYLKGFKPVSKPLLHGGGTHTPFEALWWRSCASAVGSGNPAYTWMVESDAFFNGDVARFLLDFAKDDTDLIAAGFRIAGKKWWQYRSYRQAFQRGLPIFGRLDRVVENVHPLPSLAEGNCRNRRKKGYGPGDDSSGLIFIQDHVARFSARLFEMLDVGISEGIVGPAEALVATTCASRVGLSTRENCTMKDFAPVVTREAGDGHVSSMYCWPGDDGGTVKRWSKELRPFLGVQCSSGWQDRWIHPIKTADGGRLACRGLQSDNTPVA